MIPIAQPRCQLYQRPVRFVVEFPRFIRVAYFDGNGVPISIVGGRGFFIQRHTLNDLALQANEKMGTYRCIVVVEIIPILLGRGAWVCHIMHHDVFYLPQLFAAAGMSVDLNQLLIDPFRKLCPADVGWCLSKQGPQPK